MLTWTWKTLSADLVTVTMEALGSPRLACLQRASVRVLSTASHCPACTPPLAGLPTLGEHFCSSLEAGRGRENRASDETDVLPWASAAG